MQRVSNVILELVRLLIAPKSSKHILSGRDLRVIGFAFKAVVSVGALCYIYYRLDRYESALSISSWLSTKFEFKLLIPFLIIALLLMGLNWGIEILKWHWLLHKQFKTKWKSAVKGVLSGTTFGVFTSNRFGEFIGRVLALHGSYRIQATVLSFINSLSQTLATFSFGVVGFLYLIESLGVDQFGLLPSRILQILLVGLWALLLMLYFQLPKLKGLVDGVRALRGIARHLSVVERVEASTLNRLYLFSLVRYVTFIAQYVLVFSLMATNHSFLEIGSLAMLTMFSSMLFSFIPVPDLIMREVMAISYFTLFGFDLLDVSKAVFLVWLINVALPAAIGAFTLFTYRIFKSA